MSASNHVFNNSLKPLIFAIAIISIKPTYANDGLWDMSLEELGKIRVTTLASGTATPLDKAAAIATVITAEDIEAMGARDIDEVLETVPALHVGRLPFTPPKYNIRGITSTHTPQTLMMINGIPISSLYIGHPSLAWGGFPIQAISKIEVIRGPGSALYGADAFAGVINIVTKSYNDIPENRAGIQYGSFNTANTWVNYGTRQYNTDIGLSLEYNTTDGFKGVVTEDAQTQFDSLTGTHASLAPHKMNMARDLFEARLQLNGQNWNYHLGYQNRRHGEGAGIAQAVDMQGRYISDRVNTDLTYSWQHLPQNFKLNTRMSYYYHSQQAVKDNLLYPAGSNSVYPVTVFPNLFPEGVIGNPEYREEQARFNVDGEFTGFKNHIIRTGAGFFWGDIYQVTEQKNFGTSFAPDGTPLPLFPRANGREEVADTPEIFLPEKGRSNYSIYAQDEWLFDPQWVLTTGIRYDNYADFGDTVNPRLALVWASSQDTTAKLLYGRAFRAPSISELFATSNPVTLGNADLTPETIDTYELAFNHKLSTKLSYSSNIFYYQIDDFIVFEFNPATFAKQAQNTGQVKGHGFEYEMTYTPTDAFKLIGHYAYQTSKDQVNGGTLGEAPNHDVYLRSEWDMSSKYRFVGQINYIGEQKRIYNDERPPVASYTTVDFTVIAKNMVKDVNAKLMLKNIFNADVREASQPALKPFYQKAFIPNDYPQAGRSVYLEVSYPF